MSTIKREYIITARKSKVRQFYFTKLYPDGKIKADCQSYSENIINSVMSFYSITSYDFTLDCLFSSENFANANE